MKIKNPTKRIKELRKEIQKISNRMWVGIRYEIKTFKTKDIKKLDNEGIIQTLNGQAHFLKKQKKMIISDRIKLRETLRELRQVYIYLER